MALMLRTFLLIFFALNATALDSAKYKLKEKTKKNFYKKVENFLNQREVEEPITITDYYDSLFIINWVEERFRSKRRYTAASVSMYFECVQYDQMAKGVCSSTIEYGREDKVFLDESECFCHFLD